MSRRKIPLAQDSAATPAVRFLKLAAQCRARDLRQLFILGELTKSLSELVHALQKERGACSIFLGSAGAQFGEQLAARIAESESRQTQVHELLEHIDERLDQISAGARFYARVALAFRALDSLPDVRAQVAALAVAPQDAVKLFTEIIACLLAVSFEAADVAADPETSRALVALVNFAQGKEYAGQERASGGAALSSAEVAEADRTRLRQLERAQERAFQVFSEFAAPAHVAALLALVQSADSLELDRMRRRVTDPEAPHHPGLCADAWYAVTTRRIDRMKSLEDALAADLEGLCAVKLAEAEGPPARAGQGGAGQAGVSPTGADQGGPGQEALQSTGAVAMVVSDLDPAAALMLDIEGGIGVLPMRSVLDVLKAQSRRLDDINAQLESARVALAERKTIERAKGILTRSRRLSEDAAYTLLRQTAMKQNKRMIEVAESVVSMADILK